MMYTMHMYLPTMIYVNKPCYVGVLTIMMYNIHMYLTVIIYVNKKYVKIIQCFIIHIPPVFKGFTKNDECLNIFSKGWLL